MNLKINLILWTGAESNAGDIQDCLNLYLFYATLIVGQPFKSCGLMYWGGNIFICQLTSLAEFPQFHLLLGLLTFSRLYNVANWFKKLFSIGDSGFLVETRIQSSAQLNWGLVKEESLKMFPSFEREEAKCEYRICLRCSDSWHP